MTRQRALIWNIVQNACDHPTAEQVYERAREIMPAMVLATVYNNLNFLTQHDMIRRLSLHGYPDRYDKIEQVHGHLVCRVCGQMTDLPLSGETCHLILSLNDDADGFDLALTHVCDRCKNT